MYVAELCFGLAGADTGEGGVNGTFCGRNRPLAGPGVKNFKSICDVMSEFETVLVADSIAVDGQSGPKKVFSNDAAVGEAVVVVSSTGTEFVSPAALFVGAGSSNIFRSGKTSAGSSWGEGAAKRNGVGPV